MGHDFCKIILYFFLIYVCIIASCNMMINTILILKAFLKNVIATVFYAVRRLTKRWQPWDLTPCMVQNLIGDGSPWTQKNIAKCSANQYNYIS